MNDEIEIETDDGVLVGSDVPFTPAPGTGAHVEGFCTLGGLPPSEHKRMARGNAHRLFQRLAGNGGMAP